MGSRPKFTKVKVFGGGLEVKVDSELVALVRKYGLDRQIPMSMGYDTGVPTEFQMEHNQYKEKWWFRQFSEMGLPYRKAKEAAKKMPKIQFRNTTYTLVVLTTIFSKSITKSDREKLRDIPNNALVRVTKLGWEFTKCAPRNQLEVGLLTIIEGLIIEEIMEGGSTTVGKWVQGSRMQYRAVMRAAGTKEVETEIPHVIESTGTALLLGLVEVCGTGIYSPVAPWDEVSIVKQAADELKPEE